jgi:hypothetical protein
MRLDVSYKMRLKLGPKQNFGRNYGNFSFVDPFRYFEYNFLYQIAFKIELLYLTYNTRYLTSNTTRVVQQWYISIPVSTITFISDN